MFDKGRKTPEMKKGMYIPFPIRKEQKKNADQNQRNETKEYSNLQQFVKENLPLEKEEKFWSCLQSYLSVIERNAYRNGMEYMSTSIVSDISLIQDEII